MLKNTEYNIERECKSYATIPSGHKSKENTAIAIRKELPQIKAGNNDNPPSGSIGSLPSKDRKETICLICLPPTDHVKRKIRETT